MRQPFIGSPISVRLYGKAIAGAFDRQTKIPGFDQAVYSNSSVFFIGAGGLISHVAPPVVRKGIGRIISLDDDVVEPSNLNRQRFYQKDLCKNKAVALAENLKGECIAPTEIWGFSVRFEEALERQLELPCEIAVCGVDNDPARVAASRCCRLIGISVIFTAVSQDGEHGYVLSRTERAPASPACFRTW